ncbi:MAG: hypothetical protein RsTaC01_0843 [Candidatus Paraimprobicoccus trichonymphae]|uniref:Uncharacterized protein n=1 Tax=Candidatus Paraimprobicoccus trichonymphae TaxID=3033793 RepID=A0AA48L1K3_9FIRM|nr:MAG: hypothetical protein RsTaC01_0843 [Candidatus Paraimprobicoccus trichonymphae]
MKKFLRFKSLALSMMLVAPPVFFAGKPEESTKRVSISNVLMTGAGVAATGLQLCGAGKNHILDTSMWFFDSGTSAVTLGILFTSVLTGIGVFRLITDLV